MQINIKKKEEEEEKGKKDKRVNDGRKKIVTYLNKRNKLSKNANSQD